jgi:IMP cyclohydrolase
MDMRHRAESNLEALAKNPYPGDGIVVGLDRTGEYLIHLCWIMGKDFRHRNRVFAHGEEGGCVFTKAAYPSQAKDPSLIYNAMREVPCAERTVLIVSNGHQTNEVADGYRSGRSFSEVMSRYEYGLNKQNFTPLITAYSLWKLPKASPVTTMSIVRKSPWSDACDRYQCEFNDIGRGFGYCITACAEDADPLPPFQGEPYLPLYGDAVSVAHTFWGVLNLVNCIALAVKFVPKHGPSQTIINNKL